VALYHVDMALYDDSTEPQYDEIVFKSSLGFGHSQKTKHYAFLQQFKDVVAFVAKVQVPYSYIHFIFTLSFHFFCFCLS
jgi:hypothetical protein